MYERLYDNLCKILDEMDQKDKLNTSDVQIIDWVAHAKKSLKAVEQMEDGEYSGDYNRDSSYARGRKRDSMGRYSRDSRDYSRDGYSRGSHEFREQLEELMESAPDSKTRQSIQRMMREM